jgi:capsular polysaccharide biosynthesis protein
VEPDARVGLRADRTRKGLSRRVSFSFCAGLRYPQFHFSVCVGLRNLRVVTLSLYGVSPLMEDLVHKAGAWHGRALPFVLPVIPRAFWRLLPGTSARFGPPRRWANWSFYARTHDVGWLPVVPEKIGEFPRPFWPIDGKVPFRKGRSYVWPEQGVALLKNARVISADGWCVVGRDTFLGDFCFRGNLQSSSVYALKLQRAPQPLSGVTLNLCSQHAAINFCHWTLDAVARIELVDRAGLARDSIDHVLLPHFPGATAAWIRTHLGFPADKLIHPGRRDQFRCEILLQPSYPGEVESYPPWSLDFYRRTFPVSIVSVRRRIYFPRRGRRGLLNEAEVEEELTRNGFEAFEPAGQTELHLKLSDVSHVVGIHGAALTNLVFCRPGTRVLELLPSDMPWRHFYSLCSSGGMPYGVIVGKSLRERRSLASPATDSPFHVPIDELRAALRNLLAADE